MADRLGKNWHEGLLTRDELVTSPEDQMGRLRTCWHSEASMMKIGRISAKRNYVDGETTKPRLRWLRYVLVYGV